jgi:hypothetical protein
VGIVRTPGIIGRALEDAVRTMLLNQTESEEGRDDNSIVVLPVSYMRLTVAADIVSNGATSKARRRVRGISGADGTTSRRPDDDSKYTRIVRIATQPLMLDAIDLALEASESPHDVTAEDAVCVLRMLVRWHCLHNAVADSNVVVQGARAPSDAPLLTITAQSILSRPSDARKQLAWFVGRRSTKIMPGDAGGAANGWLDDVAHRVVARIDECSAVAARLWRQHKQQDADGNEDWETIAVREAVQEEEADSCASDLDAIDGIQEKRKSPRCGRSSAANNRLLEIVEILLAAEDSADSRSDLTNLCSRNPFISFCKRHIDNLNRLSAEASTS